MMILLCGVIMVYIDGCLILIGFIDMVDIFVWFGIGYILGILVLVWLMVVVFAGVWYLFNYICFGCYVYVVGGNELVICFLGINVDCVKIGVYVICGLLVVLVGIIVIFCFFFV